MGKNTLLLKEYSPSWPPSITISDAELAPKAAIPPKADPGDVVLKVQYLYPGELEIRLRRAKYNEYTVLLRVPPSLQQKIIFDIVRKKNMTLREVGELPIRV